MDANLFPAGFNNICDVDREEAPQVLKGFLERNYPHLDHKVILLAEEHTKNQFYWQNIIALKKIIEGAGLDAVVALPDPHFLSQEVMSSSGETIFVHAAIPISESRKLSVNGSIYDFVICNNDFSNGYTEWLRALDVQILPSPRLGWHSRKKSDFFSHYNILATEFSELLEINPEALTIKTHTFPAFDTSNSQSQADLAAAVDSFLEALHRVYRQSNISHDPYVFIKNNSGTYGLGVTSVHSGKDVLAWNNKIRKKMKAVKGGGQLTEVIIQEGLPTRFHSEEGSAEPTVYMVGDQLIGGFLRTHSEKSKNESLNSPGAVFKRLCVTDFKVNMKSCPMENVYGWLAKVGALAIAHEIKSAL